MIVCSCNVLSDAAIRACVQGDRCPRTPNAVYRCLGCSPNCGRCARTVRDLINQVLAAQPERCAATCPHHHEHRAGAPLDETVLV